MIKCDKGEITINGHLSMICAEFSQIAKHVREQIGEALYTECLLVSTMTEKEIADREKMFDEGIGKQLDELLKIITESEEE